MKEAGSTTRLFSPPQTLSLIPTSTAPTGRYPRDFGASPVHYRKNTALQSAAVVPMVLFDRTVALASFSATLKLLCSIVLGAWAARKRLNKNTNATILDTAAISALSRLTYWVFQPAFLLCSVTKTFAMAAATSSSNAVPGLTLSGSQLSVMPLVAMFQIGTGAMMGKFVTRKQTDKQQAGIVSMCTTFGNSGPLPLLFADALFARSNPAIQSQVAACISFYLLAWSPFFWSFGKLILGTSDKALIGQDNSSMAKFSRQAKQFLSPPVIGSIGGIIIGATPVLRNAFLTGWAYPMFSAMQTLGTAYLPAALLVLAGSLASKKEKKEVTESASTEAEAPGLSVKSIFTIAFSRFLLAPCWALFSLWGLGRLNLLGEASSQARAILSFVILMQGCMPPAQNSVILLQLVGFTKAAQSMAKTLTVLYGLAVLPVTLLLSACLSISGIVQFL